MEYRTFGRTGLSVSVAGLGCGGNSRIGLGSGRSESETIALVREALDLGVNLFDTAPAYGTEELLGKALKEVPRDSVVIATKAFWGPLSPERVVTSLDRSLRRLGVDCVDIFQLHGLSPAEYRHAHEVLAPALFKERDKGKLRFLGVTEAASSDAGHEMIARAAADGIWDSAMVAFHMLHQNARERVFPLTQKHRVGTLLMFAVRNIFSQPGRLRATLRELTAAGAVPRALAEAEDPLGFLVHDGGARSLIDAAYRFVRHEPGVDVVLFGTGDAEHLRANIASLLAPPLPETDRDTLKKLFGRLVGIGLDLPGFAGGPAPPG